MKTFFLALALLVGCVLPTSAQSDAKLGEAILANAQAISGRTSSARRTYMESKFEAMSIKYQRRPWETVRNKGVNLELSFGPKDGKATLFTAHFDVRRASAGANNNASGCAILMHLIDVAKKLAAQPSNKRRFVFAFLDGGEARSAGAKAFCELYEGEHFQAAYNFDLCGRGDHLAIGPKKKPHANIAVSQAMDCAKAAKQSLFAYDNFLPGDHRIFTNFGVDAATISVIPSSHLPQFQKRFVAGDRSARLPPFFQDAIRGRDEAKDLDKNALALAADLGVALIHQDTSTRSKGMILVKDLKKKQKQLLELFEEGEFEARRSAIRDLGFNGTVEFIRRYSGKTPEFATTFEKLIPRLFSGKDLRAEIKNLLLKGKEHAPTTLIEMKAKITWDLTGQYYKCLP